MAINALDFENLNVGLKTNYDKAIPELIRAESPVLDMLEEDSSFTKDRGGRQLLWDILIDRQMNIGVAGEDDFFPGFSSDTNDDIDRSVPIEATQGIGYAYASLAVTEHQLAESHKKFEMFKDYGLGRWVKETQSDLRMQLEWMLLGDGTGYLGTVTGAPSLSGGNTIVTLAAASSFNARGIASTQRLYKNQKISFIRAADWATDPKRAQIVSNINALGTPVFKIVSKGQANQTVSAAPTITVGGDLTGVGGAGALASGDIIVIGKSRASAAAGGVAASRALASLKCFDGLFNKIDDGTLDTLLYGLTRASYPDLNSTCDLSAVGRQLTQERVQVLFDQIRRRRGSDDSDNLEGQYIMMVERSIMTNFAAGVGDAAKRYIQEDKARKLVAGFKNVTMAFLENETLLPIVRPTTMPFGQALLLRPKELRSMWDIKPSLVKKDGQVMRQIQGKPQYYMAWQAVGNFKHNSPWFDARLSGLNGTFSA